MKVRIAFLHRDPDGKVTLSGFQVCEERHIDTLPRIGEFVLLPERMLRVIHRESPGIDRRFEVVGIDHHWDSIIATNISVYIAKCHQKD